MSLTVAEDNSSSEIHLPADINWDMLDKSKFFFFGAALFSGVSCTLYPIIVLKTRQQVMMNAPSSFKIATLIFRNEGYRGFYSGFGTSLMGTIPARALYMSALEVTKSYVGDIAGVRLGLSEGSASVVANAAAGLSAAMAAQLVWTPIDVVSQRLMVQGSCAVGLKTYNYKGGIDAFRTIIYSDGIKGLYRGFGMSILTYAPSNAVWWASYSISHRLIWGCVGCKDKNGSNRTDGKKAAVVAVQGLSASLASGLSALVTMPLDTIKTRLQVLDGEESVRGKSPTALQTVRNLFKEGGLSACYRGLGPRWASMSLSATTMITTYEFLKRLSTKNRESFA
ncbi:mitochondrial substrate carrier family protein j [Phtheirospermum japonicum]|uniref:Mitochondrial substrate carrier family protein j n=1 Tax=Phtheirospermum japonicum TaxID=374723 RepID=A0A830CJR5_9LAMI|nr:mitochondrial substrate carrier family protein j [Phtheirospermum japonicum]